MPGLGEEQMPVERIALGADVVVPLAAADVHMNRIMRRIQRNLIVQHRKNCAFKVPSKFRR